MPIRIDFPTQVDAETRTIVWQAHCRFGPAPEQLVENRRCDLFQLLPCAFDVNGFNGSPGPLPRRRLGKGTNTRRPSLHHRFCSHPKAPPVSCTAMKSSGLSCPEAESVAAVSNAFQCSANAPVMSGTGSRAAKNSTDLAPAGRDSTSSVQMPLARSC